jgi:hypothetical protein
MTDQQVTGVAVLVLGVAALIISAGVAWMLTRLSRTRQVEGAFFITVVSFLLFVVGIVLCWFGVSAIVEGGRWATVAETVYLTMTRQRMLDSRAAAGHRDQPDALSYGQRMIGYHDFKTGNLHMGGQRLANVI